MDKLIYIIPGFGIVALIYMFFLSKWVRKQNAGNAKMVEIATYIREGALAFLKAEYRVLAIFVLIAGILLGVVSTFVPHSSLFIVVAFVLVPFFLLLLEI